MTKIALVTGASSGIGEATARALMAADYKVFAGARRLDRMAGLAAAGATLLKLDVTDDASMVAAIEAIKTGAGRLDVLVNNAGYGSYGALEDVPLDEARRQFDVNVFGLARLCQLVLPIMRAQKSGKIVNITSVGGKIWEPLGSWYHATKFAVEGLSDCLRAEVEGFGIDVIIIEPGAIRTEWAGIARDGLLQTSGGGAYAEQAKGHARLLAAADTSSLASPPTVVAKTVVRAVGARRPKTRYATGGGARTILFLRTILPDRMFDRLMRRISQGFG
jgi:NADP-dependent 3-hydroxy acid dehydrogenase YdfG